MNYQNDTQGKGRLGRLGVCVRVRAIVQNHCGRQLSRLPTFATNVSEYETDFFPIPDGCIKPEKLGKERLPRQYQIGGVLQLVVLRTD
jgi:hypothetical protein